MRAWAGWWRSDGLPALRLLAIEHWDPLGVYDRPQAADAYDAYLQRAVALLRKGGGADDLARYLGDVRTKALGRGENEVVDEAFAERVVVWYAEAAPDRRD